VNEIPLIQKIQDQGTERKHCKLSLLCYELLVCKM
jgi:hypothetical protein